MTREVRKSNPARNIRLSPRLDYSKDTFPLVSIVYYFAQNAFDGICTEFCAYVDLLGRDRLRKG